MAAAARGSESLDREQRGGRFAQRVIGELVRTGQVTQFLGGSGRLDMPGAVGEQAASQIGIRSDVLELPACE